MADEQQKAVPITVPFNTSATPRLCSQCGEHRPLYNIGGLSSELMPGQQITGFLGVFCLSCLTGKSITLGGQ